MEKAPRDGTIIIARLLYESDGESAGTHTIKWNTGKQCWTPSLSSVPLTLENKTFSTYPIAFASLKREKR